MSKQLRSFGLTVGAIFAMIGAWPLLLYGQEYRAWAVTVALLLILPALVLPQALIVPYKAWMALGYALGWINTRIILGLIFYGLVTPIGLIRHLFDKDPMGRRLRPDLDSYRIIRKPRSASHLKRQY